MLKPMEILITGLGGFIGQAMKNACLEAGHNVYTIPREILLPGGQRLKEATGRADVIVNLAGENIMGRWTDEKMIEIVESRRVITRNLVKCIQDSVRKPFLWINASAVGIYRPGIFCDEESVDLGRHFLAAVARAWENEVAKLEGVRKVILRLGLVIGGGGGILRKLMPLVKARMAVVLGNGRQEFPLIHVADVTGFMLYVLKNEDMEGTYNLVIPNAVTYREFVKALAVIRRPWCTFTLPEWLLTLLLGKAAYTLTRSAHVIPLRMLTSGYELKYRTLSEMIRG